jgi:hypothetical protein
MLSRACFSRSRSSTRSADVGSASSILLTFRSRKLGFRGLV